MRDELSPMQAYRVELKCYALKLALRDVTG